MTVRRKERHRLQYIGWLRAAVLGANDGIVSTSSLVLGVAASGATHGSILIAGIAGLVAGAMSMAVSGTKLIPFVSGASLVFLACLGGLAAHIGSANVATGIMRITFWSALAMGVTAAIGVLIGTAA